MADIRTIDNLKKFSQMKPEAPAIVFTGHTTITYSQLYETIIKTGAFLTNKGVTVRDRVSVVLPDIVDMTLVNYSVTNIAILTPLNPIFSKEMFKHYMQLLRVNWLLVPTAAEHPAKQAAEELGVGIIEISLQEISQGSMPLAEFPTGKNHDIAVIIRTSGTTANPKLIPFSHINIFEAAKSRALAERTQDDDRCLTINPKSILPLVLVGACSIYWSNFNPSMFKEILESELPTTFNTVPAVLQTLADYFDKNNYVFRDSSLRLIRSIGAPLPADLLRRLNHIFGVPVVNSYGLTETGFVTCDYMAPKGYKEGSVGVPIGCEVGILDEDGALLPSGTPGEIAVRGPNVMAGYLDNPQANEEAFINGWFITGDMGYLDEDNYLFVTGRIKELINRGGEKVSPYEVEDALLRHPSVVNAAVFPVPSDRFGEDVAAMVVLKSGTELSLVQLRNFLQGKMSHFKMPTKLYSVKEIPVGPAGKIQRKRLYEQLEQLTGENNTKSPVLEETAAPATETEIKLAVLWKDLLETDEISITDSFFDLGGDSLLVAVLFSEIERIWGIKIPLSIIFEQGSIKQLAAYIDNTDLRAVDCSDHPFLVPIQVGGSKTPLFCIHAKDGEVLSYWYLSTHLGKDQPVYGLRFNPQALADCHPLTINILAQRYIRDIRSIQPAGPYNLIGHSSGGLIALEIAHLLVLDGEEIGLLAMLDSHTGHQRDTFFDALKRNQKEFSQAGYAAMAALVLKKAIAKLNKYKQLVQYFAYRSAPVRFKQALSRSIDPEVLILCSLITFIPRFYKGEIIYYLPQEHYHASKASTQKWSQLVERLEVIATPGDHHNMILEPNAGKLAQELKKRLVKYNN